jgi:hypothetical protein
MAIILNDNLSIQAPKATDARYGPHVNTAAAISDVILANRYQGLVVGIIDGSSVVEYWWRDGIANGNLIIKVDSTANTANITAQAAFTQANTANITAQAAFTFANTVNVYSHSAYSTANSAQANTVITQGIDTTQNTWISSNATFSQASFTQANTANALAQASFNKANSANVLAQAAYDKANTGTSLTGLLPNAVIFANSTGYTSNSSALLFTSSNNTLIAANITVPTIYTTTGGIVFPDGTSQTTAGVATDSYARNTANSAQANTIVTQGVDATQNLSITAAFDKANSANVLAQAAYDKANTGGGTAGSFIITFSPYSDYGWIGYPIVPVTYDYGTL